MTEWTGDETRGQRPRTPEQKEAWQRWLRRYRPLLRRYDFDTGTFTSETWTREEWEAKHGETPFGPSATPMGVHELRRPGVEN